MLTHAAGSNILSLTAAAWKGPFKRQHPDAFEPVFFYSRAAEPRGWFRKRCARGAKPNTMLDETYATDSNDIRTDDAQRP